jgi:hypothetical protein
MDFKLRLYKHILGTLICKLEFNTPFEIMPLLADYLNDAARATSITFERGKKRVQESFPTLQLFTDAPPVLGQSNGLNALPDSPASTLPEYLNNSRATRLYIFVGRVIYVILGSLRCTSYVYEYLRQQLI